MKTPFGMTSVVIVPILCIICFIAHDRKTEKKYSIRREKRLRYEFNEKINHSKNIEENNNKQIIDLINQIKRNNNIGDL